MFKIIIYMNVQMYYVRSNKPDYLLKTFILYEYDLLVPWHIQFKKRSQYPYYSKNKVCLVLIVEKIEII